MQSRRIYTVSLLEGTSKILDLYHPMPPPNMLEATFATNVSFKNYYSEDSSRAKLRQPTGIAIDSRGNILLVDRLKNAVDLFDANGTWVQCLTPSKILSQPVGIHLDEKRRIFYVANSCSKEILVFPYNYPESE